MYKTKDESRKPVPVSKDFLIKDIKKAKVNMAIVEDCKKVMEKLAGAEVPNLSK